MMTPQSGPSRRTMLGVAAGTAIVPAPIAAFGAAPIASRWHEICRRYEDARDRAERYHATRYKPAWDRFKSIVGPCPPTTFIVTTLPGVGPLEVAITGKGDHPPFPAWDRAREMDQAYRAWMDDVAAAEKLPWWRDVEDEMERLDECENEARKVMMATPAPDAAALAYKLGIALDGDELWDNERVALKADAARLA